MRIFSLNDNDSKTFIEYTNDMGDIYKNIKQCKPGKKIQKD